MDGKEIRQRIRLLPDERPFYLRLNARAHLDFGVGDVVSGGMGSTRKFLAIHAHPESKATDLHIVSDMLIIHPDGVNFPAEVNGVPVVYCRRDDYMGRKKAT